MNKTLLFLLMSCSAFIIQAQQDSNLDSLVSAQGNDIKTLKKVKISGYVQPQFQYAESKGIKYPGGDFGAQLDKRFSIRRGRVKITYSSNPFEFVIVTENTERGISLHDFYGSYDFKKIGLKYTAGLFPRPFGFEQSYSTANHEGPERARFSTTLLPAEADLGCKLSYSKWKPLTFELGVYNGTATAADVDAFKDWVGRVAFNKKWKQLDVTGGVSYYYGSLIQGNAYRFKTISDPQGLVRFNLEDTLTNTKGSAVLRQYFGADAQLSYHFIFGKTTLRAEWMQGAQPATEKSSDSPKSATVPAGDTYSRNFNALTTYFLQKIGNTDLQLMVKYDWYDPNTDAGGDEIGAAGSNLTSTDIKYSTLGIGLNYYLKNMYIMLYYDFISNEKTKLKGFEEDLKDNVLTIRTQFKF